MTPRFGCHEAKKGNDGKAYPRGATRNGTHEARVEDALI
jgi:hypothetical protein